MTLKYLAFGLILICCPTTYGMNAARNIFSKLTTTMQVGAVGAPFAFAATHKAADYLNPNSPVDHLQNASPETKNYIQSILKDQKVINPETVQVKISNSPHAAITAEKSLFNRALVLNTEAANVIYNGLQLNVEGLDASDILFPQKARIAAQAQQLNQNSELQKIAALTAAPIAAHLATKAITVPVRSAWNTLYTTVKSSTYDTLRSIWNRAYPTKHTQAVANYTKQPTTFFRSAMRLPGTPIKFAAAAAIAAAAYRNIEQRADDASDLTRAELQSAANHYANLSPKIWHDINPGFTTQAQKAVETFDTNGTLSGLASMIPAEVQKIATDVFSPEVDNITKAGEYWARAQDKI